MYKIWFDFGFKLTECTCLDIVVEKDRDEDAGRGATPVSGAKRFWEIGRQKMNDRISSKFEPYLWFQFGAPGELPQSGPRGQYSVGHCLIPFDNVE